MAEEILEIADDASRDTIETEHGARADVLATPHTAGLTLPAIEHQSLETVAQVAEIAKGRAPKGSVNAEHWKRKEC